jgi:hypothetical protein
MSTEPPELTQAAPGPVGKTSWSCDVAEHGPFREAVAAFAAPYGLVEGLMLKRLPMTKAPNPLVLGLLG